MIVKSRATSKEINSLRVGDEIELVVSNVNNNNDRVKVMIKVIDFIKEPVKCSGCGIYLKKGGIEWYRKIWCHDCVTRRKEELSEKQMGHPRYGKEFGGIIKVGKKSSYTY